jgi:hypothetical protein
MIIVKLQGGLGNQMFQYALGRSLSIKLNLPLKLDLSFLLDRTPNENYVFRNYELDVFNVNVKFASAREKNRYLCPYNKHPKLAFWKIQRKIMGYSFYGEKDFSFDSEVLNLTGNVYLDGFWQTPKYFDGIKNTLLKDFSLKQQISGDFNLLVSEILNSNSVCIHVRRGDYVSLPNANRYHGVKGVDYFSAAISYIASIEKELKIYVFSDDTPWCIENLKFDFPTTYVEHEFSGKRPVEYLKLMSLCRHFIISNSTFAWWAAWLNQNPHKIVIVPEKWFNDTTIATSDLIPNGWIRI